MTILIRSLPQVVFTAAFLKTPSPTPVCLPCCRVVVCLARVVLECSATESRKERARVFSPTLSLDFLSNVRHLQIRYHMVRCYVCLGDVMMCFCITEEMVAHLLTKIVVGAQDHRLSLRFYSLLPGSDGQVSGFIAEVA